MRILENCSESYKVTDEGGEIFLLATLDLPLG